LGLDKAAKPEHAEREQTEDDRRAYPPLMSDLHHGLVKATGAPPLGSKSRPTACFQRWRWTLLS
jgi:hypothetical protein